MTDNTDYEQMAETFRALAHSTRLMILVKLKAKDHCVRELQEIIGFDMSTISRHLAVLRNAGIIAGRKENNQVIYRLQCPCVLDTLQCVIAMKTNNKE